MSSPKLTITTKTRAQIRAEFKEAFKDLQPAVGATVTQAQRLAPYKEEILKLRGTGVSWKQIADRMSRPPIAEAVSAKILRSVFGDAPVINPANPRPFEHRVLLDPVTNQRIPLDPVTGKPLAQPANPAAAPVSAVSPVSNVSTFPPVSSLPAAVSPLPVAPMTPKEHEAFDPLFQGLIPPIVTTKMNRRDARFYANQAVEMMPAKTVERFHALFTAELESLTESNCARYGIAPEQIAPWKRRWV